MTTAEIAFALLTLAVFVPSVIAALVVIALIITNEIEGYRARRK